MTWRPDKEVPRKRVQILKYFGVSWTSNMAKIMDSILPVLSILAYWSIVLGSFAGPGWSPKAVIDLVFKPQFLNTAVPGPCRAVDIPVYERLFR